MRDSFFGYHPFINLLYFLLVIGCALILTHPLAQMISLTCAIIYATSIEGKKCLLGILKYCLPMIMMTAFINPAFNHEGNTILLYFSNGNPLTLESILYGLLSGIMLVTILLWFLSFNRVMTSDKFIYLFGKMIPALSLIISMTLRFIPRFKSQMDIVIEAQRSIGRDLFTGSLFSRIKVAILVLSIMVTWSLENAIETADSMKSRGYGLKGRAAFSIYRFDKRDQCLLMWLLSIGLILVIGMNLKVFGFRVFPTVRSAVINMSTLFYYIIYLLLCITPVILNWREERKWKILISKM